MQKEWRQIEKLHKEGLSLMPVYDKKTIVNGVEKLPKQPCMKWGFYAKNVMPVGELYSNMEKYNTEAIGIICGAVSGNLEVVDLDVKNYLGIDAKLFDDLQTIYPQLFERLRIHKTPSGGYHILYRISDHEPEGNRKLAWKEGQKEAAIETRGNGGFVMAPPSLNYTVFKDNKIPVITWAERCAIISICEGYNEKIKVVEHTEINKKVNDYYDENPFQHYNGSEVGSEILLQYEWKKIKENNRFIWFTRPGKDNGISASFNKERRVYYVFTSSTTFEPSKGYKPSTVLSILQFGNDKKATFKYLVENGYGKINRKKELQSAKKLAKTGATELPANFSDESKQLFDKEVELKNTLYPFGTFWRYDSENDNYEISREAFYYVSNNIGFRLFRDELVLIEDYKIRSVMEREFQDIVKEYIKEEDAEENEKICNAYEYFLQRHGAFSISRLEILNEKLLLKDGKDICYKFYLNGYAKITALGIEFLYYEDLEDRLIEEKRIQKRNYTHHEGGKYLDFLKLAINYDNNPAYFNKILGYLSHEYRDEISPYIIVLTEICPDPIDGGGSGKNVFSSLFKYTTTLSNKNGSQVKYDEKFFQTWNYERIMVISDVRRDFDFGFLKEPSSGGFTFKKLFKNEVTVSVEDGPKFIIPTNFSFDITDGGLKRRIIPIEFTDFFTKANGVDIHFDCHFPNGWNENDWNGFDTFIINAIKEWLESTRKIQSVVLSDSGLDKQMEMTYGVQTIIFIKENIDFWLNKVQIELKEFNTYKEAHFRDNGVKYPPSSIKINRAINEFCKRNRIVFEQGKVITDNIGNSARYNVFTKAGGAASKNMQRELEMELTEKSEEKEKEQQEDLFTTKEYEDDPF